MKVTANCSRCLLQMLFNYVEVVGFIQAATEPDCWVRAVKNKSITNDCSKDKDFKAVQNYLISLFNRLFRSVDLKIQEIPLRTYGHFEYF